MGEPLSRRRGEINEILHIAPIRRGLVPKERRGEGSAPITYADRLKIILEAFQRREDAGFPGVIRTFRGIHTAEWALLDGDTRLLLSVVFDGDWFDYLAALTREVPGFLHLIWSNCEGWEPVDHAPEKLFRFIQAFQVRVSFLYAHHPELTVQDIDWLLALRRAAEARQLLPALDPGVAAQLAPITPEERRDRALAAYERDVRAEGSDESSVDRAVRAFGGVMSSLYPAAEVAKAGCETFGDRYARGAAP